MGNSAKRDARKLAQAQLTKKALEMRLAGASYEQIALAKIGKGFLDKSSVRKHVQRAIAEVTYEDAREALILSLMQLDTLQLGLWAKARAGSLPDVDRALRINESRRALLGVDAPKAVAQAIVSVDTTTGDPTPDDAVRAVRAFFGKVAPDLQASAPPRDDDDDDKGT